jgi:hypothetical protein
MTARRTLARRVIVVVAVLAAAIASSAAAGGTSKHHSLDASACSPGYVDAHLSWGEKCLHAGEFCKVGNVEYHAYDFDCPASGHLSAYQGAAGGTTTSATTSTPSIPATASTSAPASPAVGTTILLARCTKTSACTPGANPDRRCSPGAYYSGLTEAVICSAGFHTSTVRNVPQSEKYAVEVELERVGRPASR